MNSEEDSNDRLGISTGRRMTIVGTRVDPLKGSVLSSDEVGLETGNTSVGKCPL